MFSARTTICCLVISLSLVASNCEGQGYKPAPNCAKNECPTYTVVQTQKEFEIRSYKDARWAYGPTIPSNSYKSAASKGFKILLDYYKGKNSEHVTINMTSPVLVRVDNSSYTVFLYLPQKYQASAPQPLTKEINLINIPLPALKYAAVRRFDSVISDAVIPKQLDALKKSLKSSRDYQRGAVGDVSMVAAYNSPHELTNRVNEVFICDVGWFRGLFISIEKEGMKE